MNQHFFRQYTKHRHTPAYICFAVILVNPLVAKTFYTNLNENLNTLMHIICIPMLCVLMPRGHTQNCLVSRLLPFLDHLPTYTLWTKLYRGCNLIKLCRVWELVGGFYGPSWDVHRGLELVGFWSLRPGLCLDKAQATASSLLKSEPLLFSAKIYHNGLIFVGKHKSAYTLAFK